MNLIVLPGDGIGPEISASAVRVLRRLDESYGLGLQIETREIGLTTLRAQGTTLPQGVLDSCARADGVVLGPISHADYPAREQGGINVSAALRLELDLYANIRPCRVRPGLSYSGREPLDLVIVRENTEGFYADRNMYEGSGELMPTPDVALAIRKITASASRRIAEAAFALARRRRGRVTAVHKSNVLRVSEGLFLGQVREVAGANPGVQYEEQLVDSMAALLVRKGSRFDVVVTTNMFGDILSDLASELAGGLGLGASINRGDAHCVAQAQHGSAPDLAGKDRANPCALIASAAMLLHWFSQREEGRERFAAAAAAVDAAVDAQLADRNGRTFDLGGKLGADEFTVALCARLARKRG
jgi:3-isopropylmalate dehydrogenase